MKQALQIISLIALCLTIFPALLFFAGQMELDAVKWLMLAATAVWFIATPLWMGREEQSQQAAE